MIGNIWFNFIKDLIASISMHRSEYIYEAIINYSIFVVNKQNKWKTTSLYYILYIQGKTTQCEPTQCERVLGTKSPGANTW